MPRTVVPPVAARGERGATQVGGDSLPERLVKYVPAETLAFFVPVAGSIGSSRSPLLIAAVSAGLVGTVGYLWLAGQRAESDQRPRGHFYILAAVAFVCWAIGTSANVAHLVRIDQVTAGVILGLAVFLVPLIDEVLTRYRGRSV
jgi:hypothetical protein